MLYHSIQCATRKIGRAGYPQSVHSELEPGRKVTDPDYIWNLRGDERPSFTPYAGTVLVRADARVTDFISSATISFAFVCSGRVRAIIQSVNAGDTSFYKTTVKHKEALYPDYYLMHCLNNYALQVNYTQSEFRKRKVVNNQWVEEKIDVASFEDATEKKHALMRNGYGDWTGLEPTTLRLQEGAQINHDIFTIWGVTIRVYVSERLQSLFEKEKITGLQYNFDSEPLEIV